MRRIMAVGDSLTEGGETHVSYVWLLRRMLREAGYPVSFVGAKEKPSPDGPIALAGYGGCSAEIVRNLFEEVFPAHPADIVLLHSGHNHFIEEKPVPGIIRAYGEMVEIARSVVPGVVFLVPHLVRSGKLPKYGYIPELNEAVDRFVAGTTTAASPVVTFDTSAFDWRTDTIEDHVHASLAGATKLASLFKDALVPFLKTKESCPT